MKDVHPELNYSVGATPEFTEIPRDHTAVIESLKVFLDSVLASFFPLLIVLASALSP